MTSATMKSIASLKLALILLLPTPLLMNPAYGLDHARAKQQINLFLKVMQPWMKANRNARLSVSDLWNSDDTRGGGAGARGVGGWGHIEVILTGGFTRNPMNTPDMMLFTMCHELGHMTAVSGTHSNELPADLFTIKECLPLILRESAPDQSMDLHEELGLCENNANQMDVQLCARLLRASMDAAQFRYDFWVRAGAKPTPIKPTYYREVKDISEFVQCELNVATASLLHNSMATCWDPRR